MNTNLAVGCFTIASLSSLSTAWNNARPMPSHTYHLKSHVQRRTVIDYFNILPSLGIGYPTTPQEKRELLQADNHPIVDMRHDYLLVHPDSSPAEQLAVFRTRNKADLFAVSLPDFKSDYNDFSLFRLQHGKLRDVTYQMLPITPNTDRFLYELPRYSTTIRVFRFDLSKESRHHVFDLQWRGGHFIKAPGRT